MLIIPSVDIHGGKCVKLVRGKPGTGLKISNDPVSVAKAWEKAGAQTIHVVDLDGAFQGRRRNKLLILEILSKVEVPVEVGGGIRTAEDAKELLELGAKWVIIGTAAVRDPSFIRGLTKTVDASRVIISVDSKGNSVVTKGWSKRSIFSPEEVFRIFSPMKIGGYLYTDVSVEGTKRGIHATRVARLAETANLPLTYSGGISSVEDIRALSRCGIRGVVVGRALYDGSFTFQEAEKAARA